MKTYNKTNIKELLQTNDLAILKGMLRIYDLQTEDEKQTDDTHYNNGVGFNGTDAFILSKYSTFFYRTGYITEKQFAIAKKKMMKYAGQLAKIANGKINLPMKKIVIREDWLRPSKPYTAKA